MALVVPILLVLLFGSAELGNYFMNEHILVKAVRDGARYAARQDFTNFSAAPARPAEPSTRDTQERRHDRASVSGGTNKLRQLERDAPSRSRHELRRPRPAGRRSAEFTRQQEFGGTLIGAPIVTVSATVPYTPILAGLRLHRQRATTSTPRSRLR